MVVSKDDAEKLLTLINASIQKLDDAMLDIATLGSEISLLRKNEKDNGARDVLVNYERIVLAINPQIKSQKTIIENMRKTFTRK